MISLFEELQTHVRDILADQDCNWTIDKDINKYANSILKIFENLIDKEIKRYNDKMTSYNGQLDHSVDYYNCAERIEGLEELKEILD